MTFSTARACFPWPTTGPPCCSCCTSSLSPRNWTALLLLVLLLLVLLVLLLLVLLLLLLVLVVLVLVLLAGPHRSAAWSWCSEAGRGPGWTYSLDVLMQPGGR